ncbi:hypothetical protein UA18_03584 [Burkholderia multivorans]|uniref:GST N-terminal domain-containing protein n=1 Tax=Burkholderia multivorans TaxID=87883 RepID=A0ABD7L7A0_9BURK|nr:hypothetical protein [Burkholderia multivorans]SAJ97434.1 hypothetical protein UA18_03584 [Burkholderia multivorans]
MAKTFNEMDELPVLGHRRKIMSQSGVILDYLAEVINCYGMRTSGEKSRGGFGLIICVSQDLISQSASEGSLDLVALA